MHVSGKGQLVVSTFKEEGPVKHVRRCGDVRARERRKAFGAGIVGPDRKRLLRREGKGQAAPCESGEVPTAAHLYEALLRRSRGRHGLRHRIRGREALRQVVQLLLVRFDVRHPSVWHRRNGRRGGKAPQRLSLKRRKGQLQLAPNFNFLRGNLGQLLIRFVTFILCNTTLRQNTRQDEDGAKETRGKGGHMANNDDSGKTRS